MARTWFEVDDTRTAFLEYGAHILLAIMGLSDSGNSRTEQTWEFLEPLQCTDP